MLSKLEGTLYFACQKISASKKDAAKSQCYDIKSILIVG